MIIENNKVILFIEPKHSKSEEPVIDELTIKMFHAFNDHKNKGHVDKYGNFHNDEYTKGYHYCKCGKSSSCMDYLLKPNKYNDQQATNLLCIHYLAYHRGEISEGELIKVNRLEYPDTITSEQYKELIKLI